MNNNVLYVPGARNLSAILSGDGGSIHGTSNEDLKRDYPDAIEMSFDAALKQMNELDDQLCNEWKEIEENHYYDMLGALPPIKWDKKNGYEIFRMSEPFSSNIRSVYIKIRNHCYESLLRDNVSNDDAVSYLVSKLDRKEVLELEISE